MQSRNKTMEETMLHRTTARRERRAAIRRRRILCSNEHSKLCFRPDRKCPVRRNHLPDLTVGGISSKVGNSNEKRVWTQYPKEYERRSESENRQKAQKAIRRTTNTASA